MNAGKRFPATIDSWAGLSLLCAIADTGPFLPYGRGRNWPVLGQAEEQANTLNEIFAKLF